MLYGCMRSDIAHQSVNVLSLSLHTPAKPSNLLIPQHLPQGLPVDHFLR
jgi:hypothetical protein